MIVWRIPHILCQYKSKGFLVKDLSMKEFSMIFNVVTNKNFF